MSRAMVVRSCLAGGLAGLTGERVGALVGPGWVWGWGVSVMWGPLSSIGGMPAYSYRRATTGSSRAAWLAGQTPKTIPTMRLKPTATTTVTGLKTKPQPA